MADLASAPIRIALTLNPPAKPFDFDPNAVLQRFRERLQGRLAKKGRAVEFAPDGAVSLRIHLDPGNRALRYFIPFASPATVEITGNVRNGTYNQPVHARGAANFGLFGGSPVGMLQVAADGAATRLAKQLLEAPPTAFEPVMR
jgi:hypothetical protein